MNDVVIFNGLNSLDFHDIRANVIRIPEVSVRLLEAQEIWDSLQGKGFDFYNFLASEDDVFLRNIKLKSLAAAIVQVGLFDRYVKRQGLPAFMVGCVSGDSPLKVCIGEMSFDDMILESHAGRAARASRPIKLADNPVLVGISLSEFATFKKKDDQDKFEATGDNKLDIATIVVNLIENYGVSKLINVGPGNILMRNMQKDLALKDVQVIESIEADPMLNWFWMDMRRNNQFLKAQ